MSIAIESLPERYLQKLIRLALTDTTACWSTVDGARCQFLSPGEWNFEAGPDFLNMAALVDGILQIGDGEVHRRRSEWTHHHHASDPRYHRTLFHLFLINDQKPENEPLIALWIEPTKLQPLFAQDQALLQRSHSPDIHSLEILQEYAYARIRRKTETFHLLLTEHDHHIEATLQTAIANFFQRQRRYRRRPKGLLAHQDKLNRLDSLQPWLHFLQHLHQNPQTPDLLDQLEQLVTTPLAQEGKGTRMELMINILLPLSLSIAHPADQEVLLMWFWAQPAPHRYNKLARKFPSLPQEYVWQQQGMLEYLRECQYGRERCAELLLPYFIATDPKTFADLPKTPLE